MLAPDTEAPAEMHWFIEQFKAVTAAENCCHTLHNTYSIRGTKIRDPLAWSKYLQQTIDMWGDRVEIMYGMHHWPSWGRDRVLELLGMAPRRLPLHQRRDAAPREPRSGPQRDRRAGAVPADARAPLGDARLLRVAQPQRPRDVRQLPRAGSTAIRPPSTPYPPEEAAKRYVEFMGGAAAALDKARGAFELGDYRWVAEVVNHVVFADPDNKDARELQAQALEQLGYQSESGPWRNFYLTGAQELRHGVRQLPTPNTSSPDTVRAMSTDLFLDYLGMRLNGSKAGDRRITLGLTMPDVGESWTLMVRNGALSHHEGAGDADATVTIDRDHLNEVILGVAPMTDQIERGTATIEGRRAGAARLHRAARRVRLLVRHRDALIGQPATHALASSSSSTENSRASPGVIQPSICML